MKTAVASLVALLLVGTAFGRQLVQSDLGVSSGGSPVTRVVRLLKDLEEKLEKDADAEKDLYDKFVCWATSTVEAKTKSNDEARARISSLEAYIADISSGKLTFTDEKETLTKDLQTVIEETGNLTADRDAQNMEFLKVKEDSEDAIQGLDTARSVLRQAAKGESGSLLLLSLRGSAKDWAGTGAVARREKIRQLKKAVDIGDRYLSKANALFLRRIITGQVNEDIDEPDADITEEYQSRTGGVVKKLDDLWASFKKDLKKDVEEEEENVKTFTERKATKDEQKAAVESALQKLEKEFAARAQAKEQSQDEIDTLTDQVKADEDMISSTNTVLKEKQGEWDERLTYRQGEMEALGKAIELLTSDDARDLFRKSAANFLQLSASAYSERARTATQALRLAAGAAKDPRLLILASRLAAARRGKVSEDPDAEAAEADAPKNPTFDAVLAKMDAMKEAIKSEEEADFEKKETCESELVQNLATKKEKERAIEDEETTMSFAKGKIAELSSQIDKTIEKIAEVDAQLADAQQLRESEAAEFEASEKDDQDAVTLIEKAAKFVTDFYDSQNTSLLQTRSDSKQLLPDDLRAAGAPGVWKESSYGGAGSQSTGVIQTMQMVADDVKKEMAVAKKEEDEAIAQYEKTKADLEEEKSDLETAQNNLQKKKGERETEFNDASTEKASVEGEHASVVQTMADVKPACDFYLGNFEARQKNRQTELNGLDRAKAILKGSFFEDKSRELTVGDS